MRTLTEAMLSAHRKSNTLPEIPSSAKEIRPPDGILPESLKVKLIQWQLNPQEAERQFGHTICFVDDAHTVLNDREFLFTVAIVGGFAFFSCLRLLDRDRDTWVLSANNEAGLLCDYVNDIFDETRPFRAAVLGKDFVGWSKYEEPKSAAPRITVVVREPELFI